MSGRPCSRRAPQWPSLVAVFALAALTAGCVMREGAATSFEKTLTVDGPVRLEVRNGAGDTEITPGPPGQVHIRGEYRLQRFIWAGARRLEDLRDNPPIEQSGNTINIGLDADRLRYFTITYKIAVPRETLVRARAGSGDIRARGIRGPLRLNAGSGDIAAEDIGDEVEAGTGSGDIHLLRVEGPVSAGAGSGDLVLDALRDDVRARTGSGDITVSRPARRLHAITGSGDIRITDATADINISTDSGDLTILGNPAANSYWDLRTSSGEVRLDLSPTASFRFYARTNSGRIETRMPLVVEDKDRRTLRARAGNGDARIEVVTSSGNIRIR